MKHHSVTLTALFLSLFAAFWLLSPPPASAANIVVTTTLDVVANDGLCSLREAIYAANNNAAYNGCAAGTGSDTIQFDSNLPTPAIFVLTIAGTGEDAASTGDLDLTGVLAISGDGQANTIIDGNAIDRVLHVHPSANVTISGVTVRHGDPGAANGGGIAVEQTGRLTLNTSTVISNTAVLGGGAYSLGGLTLNDSTVQANKNGGLHNNAGLLALTNVQVLKNSGGYGITNENKGGLQYTGGRVSENIGGGILNDNATAQPLTDLTIDLNTVGGGLHNKGLGINNATLTITNSSIHNNAAASGAGLFNEGAAASATVENSQISSNIATAAGGGISNNGTLTLKTSTIDNNQGRSGGGIDHQGVSFNAENVTISGNTATDNGGGIANQASTTLANVTVSGNSGSTGANILNGDGASLSFVNTIVANPVSGANCANTTGTLTSLGYNLESANSCSFTGLGDIINTDPLLGPLQNNGGPTLTHALPIGSPAIDMGGNTPCLSTDQRGVSRPLDGDGDALSTAVCDIGAYEAGALVCGIEAGTSYTISGLSLTVTNLGTDLSCVQVTNLPFNHPLATTAIPDEQYWVIDGLQQDQATAATPDYIFNLTLPTGISPHETAKVCKSPGGLGGAGWDCDRTSSIGGLVWRDGITVGFSDWAVGEGGPTALTLNAFSASSAPGQITVVTILFGAFAALLFTWKLWRYRQPE